MKLINADEALRMIKNSKQDNPLSEGMKGIWETAHDCCLSCVEAVPETQVVEQIFADLEDLLDKHFTKANFTDGTCTFLYDRGLEVDITNLKKKYGV